MPILTKDQATQVIAAMSSNEMVSFDFNMRGSIIEKAIVHERAGNILVWQQIGYFAHKEERYISRSDFVRAYS